jgi:hypothetical protein
MHRRICLLAALLGVAPSHPSVHAAEVRHRDGTVRSGKLVTLILLGDDGNVYEYDAEDIAVFLPGPTARRYGPVPRESGGSQAEAPPTPEGSLPPGQPGLELELSYQSPVAGPEALRHGTDPGEAAEVFAFRPEDERVRTAWIRLGEATRVENRTLSSMDSGEECQRMAELLRDDDLTRKQILATLARERRFTHRMRYVLRRPLSLDPGPWNVYVHFPRLGRHRLFRGVRLRAEAPTRLAYSWSDHRRFGD